ncbi:MAG: helix-hairpin-helix domain-containing protein [Patescibacteria group bacterium]
MFSKIDWNQFLNDHKGSIILFLCGFILLGLGVFYVKSGLERPSTKVEVLNKATQSQAEDFFAVEVSGSVEKPGVYKLDKNSRVEDALILAGGLSQDADRQWVERFINRASKITDGQKIFIQSESQKLEVKGQNSQTGVLGSVDSLVNINTATLSQLDKLPGIGPTYGQNIIDHRPYSTGEELLSKGVLKKSVYEKIRDKITVY